MPPKQLDFLEQAGFTTEDPESPRRLAVSSVGHEKSGKSHFGIMTMPEPIAVISLDAGAKEIVAKARAAGRKVHHHRILVPRPKVIASHELQEQQRKFYGPFWDDLLRAFDAVVRTTSIRSLLLDTGTEAYELGRLAYFGKLAQVKAQHYVEVNAEFRKLVKGTYDERPDLNIVIAHKFKKEYRESSKGGDSNWTGKYEMAGFGDVNFIMDLIIHHGYDANLRRFTVTVPKVPGNCNCRFGDHVVGFELPGEADLPCDFPTLAMEAVPGSSYEDWV